MKIIHDDLNFGHVLNTINDLNHDLGIIVPTGSPISVNAECKVVEIEPDDIDDDHELKLESWELIIYIGHLDKILDGKAHLLNLRLLDIDSAKKLELLLDYWENGC